MSPRSPIVVVVVHVYVHLLWDRSLFNVQFAAVLPLSGGISPLTNFVKTRAITCVDCLLILTEVERNLGTCSFLFLVGVMKSYHVLEDDVRTDEVRWLHQI